jgi:hypothetical protein
MKLTIQLLKESNMNISSERTLAEEMYQDEIMKLKAALKAANLEIKSDKEKIDSLSTQLEKQTPKISSEPSNVSSFQKPSKMSSSENPFNVISPAPHMMVSISRSESLGGSTVSAADCADVKIDNIKGKLLKKFGWTEVEDTNIDDNFSLRLYEEIEQLKLENKRLVERMKAENVDVSDVENNTTAGHVLTRNLSTRRVFAQPGSAPPSSSSSRRVSEGGVPRRRNIKDECASVSVSKLKEKFLKDTSASLEA